jgi:hypothetical protein
VTDLATVLNNLPVDLRAGVQAVQDALFATPDHLEGDCFPLRHEFAGGVYARTITLPKDSLIVGKIHRHEHHNFILRGKVAVLTEFGPEILTGPCQFVSRPGTKRAVYAIEETEWCTIHNVGEERDLGKIEDIVIAKSYEEIGMVSPINSVGRMLDANPAEEV